MGAIVVVKLMLMVIASLKTCLVHAQEKNSTTSNQFLCKQPMQTRYIHVPTTPPGAAGSDTFFPIGNTGPALIQIDEAKAVCRRCPVVDECLRWALESGQDAGVWGGLSEDERRALKRRNARMRARTNV